MATKLDGRCFLGFGAAKEYCSFYTGRAPMEAHAAELAGYRLWKGTINFPPDRPLPTELVAKLVQARLTELRALRSSPRPRDHTQTHGVSCRSAL
jgi:uncharacterized protein YdhG (YjbR/CyaY superfamily)